MQIKEVVISNYRNLDGVKLALNLHINFLVGENELGKSNFLDMLETLFNQRSFSEEDFSDPKKPIRIEFSLVLSEIEKGAFEDIFDPQDSTRVNVIAKQEPFGPDEVITFFRKENFDDNPIEIPYSLFRRVNFIRYDSLRAAREDLTFQRGRGVSRFLIYLIRDFIGQDKTSTGKYIDKDSVDALIRHIDQILQRLKPFRTHRISPFTDEDKSLDLLTRILKLRGANGFDIQKSGGGVQFSALIILSILERLVYLKQSKRWTDGVFTSKRAFFLKREYESLLERFSEVRQLLESLAESKEDKIYIHVDRISDERRSELPADVLEEILQEKSISLILGLDEPEIHLHPYRQRSLIKYISGILNNIDKDFSFVLKELFGIDNINGQAIIVSHSPNVLLDDYRSVARFYKENGIRVVSGETIQFDTQLEKHLLRNLPYIKEAFFSRCVILVEGDTELGALPLWAEGIIGDLDEFGITTVSVQGVHSVPAVVKLLNELKIPNVSVIDKDDDNDVKFSGVEGLEATIHRDFEEELFEAVYSNDSKVAVLFEVVEEYEVQGLNRAIDKQRLEKIARNYSIKDTWASALHGDRCKFSDIASSVDKNLLKVMFLSWLTSIKAITLGRLLGSKINGNMIPHPYRDVLEKARLKAEQSHGGSDREDN